MIRASQRLAPKRSSSRFDGTSHSAYPDKEKSRAEPVDRRAEVQVPIHLQRGKADVDAIHEGQPIADSDHRDQPQACLALR
jgi:hypothetical protein